MEVPSSLKVGQRFSLLTDRGTIRYIGQVQDTKGTWLGVEWDNSSRGKHNGIINEIRYFHCRQAESCASFIRFSQKLAFGTSFLKALSTKYLPPLPSHTPIKQPSNKPKYSRRNLAEIEIETPNFEGVIKRAARLVKLREAGLGGWKQALDPENSIHQGKVDTDESVAFAFGGEEKIGDIKKTCPNLTWLDLSRSLISNWNELALICVELEKLESLLLHFNRMEPTHPQIPENWCSSFLKVKDLRLDGTLMDWSEVLFLEKAFPSLELLQLGHNDIRMLGTLNNSDSTQQGLNHIPLRNLRILNLEGNKLSDWEDLVKQISSLPSLQRLILSSNRIQKISAPSSEKEAMSSTSTLPPFPSLDHVSLLDNPIEGWSDLEALDSWLRAGRNKAPPDTIMDGESQVGLKSLAVGGESSKVGADLDSRDFRLITIARLGALETFNGGLVRPAERKDGELFYLSRCAAENLPETIRNQTHPRYEELSQIYGAPQAPKPPDKNAGTLRSKLIELAVYSLDVSNSVQPPSLPLEQTPLKVKLLISSPIRLVKAKLAKTLKLKPQNMEKMYAVLSPETTALPEEAVETVQDSERVVLELDDERRDLDWYEVKEGTEIILLISN